MVMSAKELSGWYESTGLYTGVSFSDSTGIPAVKAIKKTASNHIALWITADLVAPGSRLECDAHDHARDAFRDQ